MAGGAGAFRRAVRVVPGAESALGRVTVIRSSSSFHRSVPETQVGHPVDPRANGKRVTRARAGIGSRSRPRMEERYYERVVGQRAGRA